MSSNTDNKSPVESKPIPGTMIPPTQSTAMPPKNQEPLTPEQLLLNIIISNNQILQKMARVMEQQIIYTNALLFPNNDRSTSTNPSGTGTTGNQQKVPPTK